jgi:tripartite-type tricarboxylate transporter receptor subunit TctC
MANNLYNVAPRDGTAIGLPPNAIALESRLHTLTRAGGNAAFDVSKFSWLGTAARQPQVFFVSDKSGVTSAQELKTRKVIVAAISVGSDAYVLPVAMNRILGGKMQIVTGYHGLDGTLIALERGEVEGANSSFAGLLANKSDWIRDKRIHILIQFGRERLPTLPDVPTAIELASDPRDKAALRFYSYKYDVAYALITPPDVPAERIAALRTAFEETMKDSEYVAAAKHMRLPLNSLNGEAVSKIIADIEATPQDIVDRMRALMAPLPKG